MSIPQIIKLTTKRDDRVLGAVSKLSKLRSDVLNLIVKGKSIFDISCDLNRNYNHIIQILLELRIELQVGSNHQMLSLVIPAMIRKECQDKINMECVELKEMRMKGMAPLNGGF